MSDATHAREYTGDVLNSFGLPTVLLVDHVEDICPSIRRIHFEGLGVADFLSQHRLPHIRLAVPRPDGTLGLPALGDTRTTMDPELLARTRTYTVRKYDYEGRTMAIDFFLHGGSGLAETWARNAGRGSTIGVVGGGGRTLHRASFMLIAADDAGIPEASLILESLPDGQKGRAFLEVNDLADWQELRIPQGMEVTWLNRNGTPAGESDLLPRAIASTPIDHPARVSAFVAAESGTAAQIRDDLRERGVPQRQRQVSGFWQRGRSEADGTNTTAQTRKAG